jgi:hypothetical protein
LARHYKAGIAGELGVAASKVRVTGRGLHSFTEQLTLSRV